MKKQLSPSRLKRHYQNHIAKMVHSFFMQTLDKEEEEIKKIWKSFCDNWHEIVSKVNKQYNKPVLSYDVWERTFIDDGYKNIITKPMNTKAKASILRIIYIVEVKTQAQRERREAKYKLFFIIVRTKYFFLKLFGKA